MSFFGLFGDEDSSSTTATTNDTTNNATSIDKRSVASESAVSLTGDGNTIDRSSATNFFDTSNRSSTDITSFLDKSVKDSSSKNSGNTSFADTSNRSVNTSTSFTDASDRSVHNTLTDYGSVNSAMSLSGAMSAQAFGVADKAVGGAIDVLKLQTIEGNKTVMAAFDMARSSGANSMATSAAVLGFASSAMKETSAAFAEAKDGGQSKMVMAALVAVAVIGVAFAVRN